VRELAHEMKRLVVLSRGPLATAADLSPEIVHTTRTTSFVNQVLSGGMLLKAAVDESEQRILHEALMALKYNQVQAVRKLSCTKQMLWRIVSAP
jgi:DNA-binding NtrC family response regulator